MARVLHPLALALSVILLACAARRSHAGFWSDLFGKQPCPPSGFNAIQGFDVSAYAAAPWYPQKQVPLIYQKQDDLYCVQAQYKLINSTQPNDGVFVYNSARKGSITGELQGNTDSGSFALQAIPESGADRASKLQVGPKALSSSFLRSVAYGPYWVVAVGASSNATLKYDWAVISGGAPSYKSDGACSTFNPLFPTTWQYRGGLWLFTRRAYDPAGSAAAEAAARALGFNMNQLVAVTQQNCTYAPLRP